jgi:hypothetical protein
VPLDDDFQARSEKTGGMLQNLISDSPLFGRLDAIPSAQHTSEAFTIW